MRVVCYYNKKFVKNKMTMNKKILLITLLLFSVLIFGQKWEYLGQNDKGDKTYIQDSAINSSSSNYAKIWSKELVKNYTVQKNGKKILLKNAIIKSLYSYNCSERKVRLLQIVFYDANEKYITGNDYPDYNSDSEWYYVTPETTGEARLEFVCSKL